MTRSPSDDPFADLFGKLPDPRSRELRSSGEDAGHGARPDPAPASGPVPAGADSAPLSRRAAREAAARQATGAAPTMPEPPAVPAAPAAPAAPAPAAAEPASSRVVAGLFSQAPSTPEQTSPDDAWAAVQAESAPALPYSRGAAGRGASAQVTAQATAERAPTTATLDDLFSGSSSTDELGDVPPPKNKRRRRIGGWIALGVILLILGGAAGGAWYVWTTYEDQIREVMGWEEPNDYETGLANGETFITIESGDTGSPISQKLYDAGVTMTPEAFYDFLIESGENPPFQPGFFRLQKQMTSEAALAALLDPANRMENTAQLREGLTVDQSLPLLADGTGIPLEELQTAASNPAAYGVSAESLEGWLFPATYTFSPEATATDVISRLVNETIARLDAAGVPVDDRQRILTIASIIQREARFEADMQKVSTVIVNRLDPNNQETFGYLQMDSTAQYGYGELHAGSASTSEEAQYDDNPWNTYVHTGLPVGPISNPGDMAIAAALNPAEGDWLYFVTVNLNTGETVFTTNLADHNRAVAQWQSWCSENPGSGC